MTIFEAIFDAVDSGLLVVMAVSFVAVVWWGFRRRGNGADGGDVPGASLFDGDGESGDGGDGGD